MRELRYAATEGCGLRATGHTATDQVETVLYRIVSSGSTRGIRVRREDGVVRPLLDVTREETRAYCEEHGLPVRVDATNAETTRGLIRDEILPLLRRLHPGAEANLRALGEERPSLPRALEASLVELLSSRAGSRSADLGGGVRAVREYDTLRLEGTVEWGPWTLEADRDDSRCARGGRGIIWQGAARKCRISSWTRKCRGPSGRPGRSSCCGDEVVAVPGIAAAPGWEGAVDSEEET